MHRSRLPACSPTLEECCYLVLASLAVMADGWGGRRRGEAGLVGLAGADGSGFVVVDFEDRVFRAVGAEGLEVFPHQQREGFHDVAHRVAGRREGEPQGVARPRLNGGCIFLFLSVFSAIPSRQPAMRALARGGAAAPADMTCDRLAVRVSNSAHASSGGL